VVAARQGTALGAFAAAATRGLPRDVASFTGRRAELDRLAEGLDGLAAGGGVVGICAIGGMAGVGKTTFAVHAAHRLAVSPTASFTCRCTAMPVASGRWTRRMRCPACC
jgi:hypothetical protein